MNLFEQITLSRRSCLLGFRYYQEDKILYFRTDGTASILRIYNHKSKNISRQLLKQNVSLSPKADIRYHLTKAYILEIVETVVDELDLNK